MRTGIPVYRFIMNYVGIHPYRPLCTRITVPVMRTGIPVYRFIMNYKNIIAHYALGLPPNVPLQHV
jgi:hypothetical protein